MADSFNKLPIGTSRFLGYKSNVSTAEPGYLSRPSQNCMVLEDGQVSSRLGYLAEFSIGVDGSPATCFYHITYDVSFYALGTKVYYRDHTTNLNYDTGITLTTGTTTRFAEFSGDVYITNSTDGVFAIRCMRLNDSAATAGDGTVTVDVDGASRISVFGDIAAGGSGDDLRIAGTDEQMASLVVATGVVTLSGTLSASYADNTLAIVVRSYSIDDASKIVFWKARLHLMGFPLATNADQPNNTVLTGQFVNAANNIELILDFTFGTGGSTRILVAGGGRVTNILGVADAIYFFTERKVFATVSSEIDTTGSSIGLTIPREKDSLHGCINEDCATVIGNSALTYITSDGRFMRIPIDPDTGTAIGRPEEDFDVDIREHLKNMDKDQTGALVYHYNGGRQTIYQVKLAGQWYWFIWDENIVRPQGSNFVRGAWQAPQQIAPVRGFFERNKVLYGTDVSDDTVYSFFTTFTDNLTPIYSIIATGELNVGNAMLQRAELQGDINQPTRISIKAYVWNEEGGKRSGSAKTVLGSDYTYSEDNSVGAVPVGDGGVEGETTQTARWKRSFDIFPSESNRVQLVLENDQDGSYYSLSAYSIYGKQFPNSFSKSL